MTRHEAANYWYSVYLMLWQDKCSQEDQEYSLGYSDYMRDRNPRLNMSLCYHRGYRDAKGDWGD